MPLAYFLFLWFDDESNIILTPIHWINFHFDKMKTQIEKKKKRASERASVERWNGNKNEIKVYIYKDFMTLSTDSIKTIFQVKWYRRKVCLFVCLYIFFSSSHSFSIYLSASSPLSVLVWFFRFVLCSGWANFYDSKMSLHNSYGHRI